MEKIVDVGCSVGCANFFFVGKRPDMRCWMFEALKMQSMYCGNFRAGLILDFKVSKIVRKGNN